MPASNAAWQRPNGCWKTRGGYLPKGRVLPLPLLCTTSFGAPLHLEEDEDKAAFLARTRDALLALAPEHS